MSKSKIESLEKRVLEAIAERDQEFQALEASSVNDEALLAEAEEAFDQASKSGDFDAFKKAADQKHEAETRIEWRQRRKKALEESPLISEAEGMQMIDEALEEVKRIDQANKAKVAEYLEKIISMERDNTEIIDRANEAIKRMKADVLHKRHDPWKDGYMENKIRDFVRPLVNQYRARGSEIVDHFRK